MSASGSNPNPPQKDEATAKRWKEIRDSRCLDEEKRKEREPAKLEAARQAEAARKKLEEQEEERLLKLGLKGGIPQALGGKVISPELRAEHRAQVLTTGQSKPLTNLQKFWKFLCYIFSCFSCCRSPQRKSKPFSSSSHSHSIASSQMSGGVSVARSDAKYRAKLLGKRDAVQKPAPVKSSFFSKKTTPRSAEAGTTPSRQFSRWFCCR